ncbi:2-oxoisovalerate dehydrogenase E1 subunit beta [Anabaena lutea]|uniref:2-oxoisovalerate dehydrogenase E1 subunit beta n=1 Tax=Anabaena lutea FACHB-196 TaxID=2692881 RepID=A0ABR8FMD6_9NOST|nr:2-oxoisovalerate dehydrogenase E1 subunit beta [Anabaena lutea]MBD2570099.1 2-oxoisovalerate dehydrogenase E1 subunit beta [Anabaena lutea FACHB-196]
MIEIVFLVEDDPDGGYTATALGQSIFTQADDIETLRVMIRDAVRCHFPDQEKCPKIIQLQNIL